MVTPPRIERRAHVPEDAAGDRFDRVLARLFPEFSRGRLQAWTRDGQITLDGAAVKPSARVRGGETVAVDARPDAAGDLAPEPIALNIVHQDDAIIVLNKPAGLVVHPAAGHPSGTLQNALLHHDASLAAIPRAGLVHRLDKLTSGVMVVARTLTSHQALVRQLQERTMSRRYLALARGSMIAGGTVDAPIGRSPYDRKRMAVIAGARSAVTHYRIRERFTAFTLLDVRLETGRTHQIRVHLAHLRHPLVGDPVYGGRGGPPRGAGEALRDAIQTFPRQALHAYRLSLDHPGSQRRVTYEAEIPSDMETLLGEVRRDASQQT